MKERPKRNKSKPVVQEEPLVLTKKVAPASTVCGICGKVFKYDHKLRVHLRTHTGETPFPCTRCNKAFAQKAALTVHERTHTGEKPFVCGLCSKAFARADHLHQHNRTHTGEKPHACGVCSKAFATWSALSRHKGEHSDRESFSCTNCTKSFSRLDNLRSHVLKAHGPDLPGSSKKPRGKASSEPKKKKAQAKRKAVSEEHSIECTPNQDDMMALAKILGDDEDDNNEGNKAEAQDANMPVTETRIKDEPVDDDEIVENSVIIHDNMESSPEKDNTTTEPYAEEDCESDNMFGSHFLYA